MVFFKIYVNPRNPLFSPFLTLISCCGRSMLSGVRPVPFRFCGTGHWKKNIILITFKKSFHQNYFPTTIKSTPLQQSKALLYHHKKQSTTTIKSTPLPPSKVLLYHNQEYFFITIKRTTIIKKPCAKKALLIYHHDCRGSGSNWMTLRGYGQ